MPLVSIITPVYNAEKWLPMTMASVNAQTLADWEHLLVDDGSKDSSREIIEAAARSDSRIRLLRTPQNGGPSAARNLGIQSARGRYIAFLDADDLWLPEKLERSIEWMKRQDAGFIYHDYRHISHDGLRVGRLVHGPNVLTLQALHTHRGTGCLTVVIDRQKIPAPVFPPIAPYHAEDFCLWADIVRNGHPGRRFPADLARYRLSATSRSANKLEGAFNTWRLYRRISKLPLAQALSWWMQYAWNALVLHMNARPRLASDPEQ